MKISKDPGDAWIQRSTSLCSHCFIKSKVPELFLFQGMPVQFPKGGTAHRLINPQLDDAAKKFPSGEKARLVICELAFS